jgi:hypothetical protein
MVKMMMAGSLFVLQMALATSPAWAKDATETNREAPHGLQAPYVIQMSMSPCESSCEGVYFKCKDDGKKCAEARAKCYRSCKKPS